MYIVCRKCKYRAYAYRELTPSLPKVNVFFCIRISRAQRFSFSLSRIKSFFFLEFFLLLRDFIKMAMTKTYKNSVYIQCISHTHYDPIHNSYPKNFTAQIRVYKLLRVFEANGKTLVAVCLTQERASYLLISESHISLFLLVPYTSLLPFEQTHTHTHFAWKERVSCA